MIKTLGRAMRVTVYTAVIELERGLWCIDCTRHRSKIGKHLGEGRLVSCVRGQWWKVGLSWISELKSSRLSIERKTEKRKKKPSGIVGYNNVIENAYLEGERDVRVGREKGGQTLTRRGDFVPRNAFCSYGVVTMLACTCRMRTKG